MTEAAAIKATFADIQTIKSRGMLVLKFELPIEQADAALRALGGVPIPGTERWCGIARLTDTVPADAPAKDYGRSQTAKVAYANKDDGEKAIVRAVMLARDPQFQAWLVESGRVLQASEDIAARYIREVCDVKSRSEIATSPPALREFLALETTYDLYRKGYFNE